MLAADNIELLKQNGFEVEIADDVGSGQRNRLNLVAQPVSKSTVFDMKGTYLQHFMSNQVINHLIRPGRIDTFNAGPTTRPDGQVLEGKNDVCHEGMSKERHGWNAA